MVKSTVHSTVSYNRLLYKSYSSTHSPIMGGATKDRGMSEYPGFIFSK